ncbi:MAG: carboxylate-amine ligase [Myxococcota bacterium]|nr:carboxylate-amine ligase [Myxococcota bacterium]
MKAALSPFSVGVEEEYLLVDVATGDLADDPGTELFQNCQKRLGEQVSHEFLRSQIEVGTKVCYSIGEVRNQIQELRGIICEEADKFGLAPIASACHPFAKWTDQKPTSMARYSVLAGELQTIGQRLVTCGMHIHLGLPDPDLRIDLMNQICHFVPHLLALSTSSPFWGGRDTGLKSFRLSVFDGLPRTGLPQYFDSYAQFQRFTLTMVESGIIEDASKLWWDIRPSHHYPTIEVRIMDVCTKLEDALALTAMYLSLSHRMLRLRRQNQKWRQYSVALLNENRWRAQRYGLDEGLVDFGRRKIIPWAEELDDLIDLVGYDAEKLGCLDELLHLRTILERGTSADRQLRVFRNSLDRGQTEAEALVSVVHHLVEETRDS